MVSGPRKLARQTKAVWPLLSHPQYPRQILSGLGPARYLDVLSDSGGATIQRALAHDGLGTHKDGTVTGSPGRPPADWPTQATDQQIAVDILKRHCERFGHVRLIERLIEPGDLENGTFEVVFPPWMTELTARFDSLYGPETGSQVYEKTLRWLMRDIFDGYEAVELH